MKPKLSGHVKRPGNTTSPRKPKARPMGVAGIRDKIKMAANIAGMMFMPYYNQIMQILETNQDLKKTAKGIFHQVCYAAVGTAVGGAVGGPPGAFLGGCIGGFIGLKTVETYESLISVLRELTDENKQRLVQKVQELVGSGSLEALTAFIGTQVNRELFINLIREFASQTTKGG